MMPEFEVVQLPLLTMDRVASVLEEFESKRGRLPAALVVNPVCIGFLQKLLRELDCDIPVRGTGGALLHEMWLQVNDDTRKEKASA